jgi:Ca2+/Na+ antiporter
VTTRKGIAFLLAIVSLLMIVLIYVGHLELQNTLAIAFALIAGIYLLYAL